MRAQSSSRNKISRARGKQNPRVLFQFTKKHDNARGPKLQLYAASTMLSRNLRKRYQLIQCNTLTTLMMSPWRPIFCVRLNEKILEVTSFLGQQLVMAEHVPRPLAVVRGHAYRAQQLRGHLKLSNVEITIELIDNQLILILERQLEELIDYCREFYSERAHTEGCSLKVNALS